MQHTVQNAARKIVSVLDGQPTGMKGQSLLEMAFTFPILILMVLSLVEVGFAANNYLILMDVVRGAGRAAVNLDPVFWDPAKR
ncbi:MAG: pilus assembly protein, partial [Anaerolineae bacterium]|nr:pilus assembly protein [Anaerolineae bacterium]